MGLIPRRETATLEAFVNSHMASRTDVKARTQILYSQTRGSLWEFIDPKIPLADITPGDAAEWRLYMLGAGLLGDNTVRRRCGRAVFEGSRS